MAQPYLLAGVVGVVLTVAFYEGRNALRHGSGPQTNLANVDKAAGAHNECELSEGAYQKMADSLMQCQSRLADRERGASPPESETNAALMVSAPEPPPYSGDRFDPSAEEWNALADQGRVKLSRPCTMTDGWLPAAEELHSVGLADNDAQAVADVYKAASARAWDATRANCAEWLGVDVSIAERIGSATCESLLDMAAQKDEKVFRRVAEARAGRRNERTLAPVERYYLAKTKELKEFESDLAKRVGSEATRKITESTTFCMYRELWPELPQ